MKILPILWCVMTMKKTRFLGNLDWEESPSEASQEYFMTASREAKAPCLN